MDNKRLVLDYYPQITQMGADEKHKKIICGNLRNLRIMSEDNKRLVLDYHPQIPQIYDGEK